MAFRHVKPPKRLVYGEKIRNIRITDKNNEDGTIDCVLETYDPTVNDLPDYSYNNLDAMLLRGESIKMVDSKVLGINPNGVEGAIDNIIGKDSEDDNLDTSDGDVE
nr:unnamed protein product [uncultured bacterium]